MTYQDVGPRGPVVGVSDANYQVNPFLLGTGWDVVFDASQYFSNLTGLEIYHVALDGPIGSSLVVLRDGKTWDYVAQGWKNGWDPSQPLPIPQQNLVQFCWNFAYTSPPYSAANVQPTVTLWLRQQVTGL